MTTDKQIEWTGPVLLTADEQRGKRQYQNDDRKKDYAYIWRWLCQLAKEQYGCMIVAGDFFDSPKPTSEDFNESADDAASAGVPIGVIDGNHDEDQRSWFDSNHTPFYYLDDKRVTINGCQIHFLSYRSRENLLSKLQDIKKNYEQTDVIVGHQMFQELSPTVEIAGVGAIGQFGAKDLIDIGFRNLTIFLGDLHTSSDWRDDEHNLAVIYPGSPEMTEKGEGRHKSALQGDWEDQKFYAIHWEPTPGYPQTWVRIPTDHRPWLKYEIDATKPGWETMLQGIIPEVKKTTEDDHLRRLPVVHVRMNVVNYLHIEGTYWNKFIEEMRPLCCVFDFCVKELQSELPTESSADEDLSIKNSPDKGIELLKALLSEATIDTPNQNLILSLCDTALRGSKEMLADQVQTELTKTS